VGNKNFNTQVINWAKNNKVLKIVDDQISSPTYANDLAYFSWKLYKTKNMVCITFNDKEASKYDQAKYLLSKLDGLGRSCLPKAQILICLPKDQPIANLTQANWKK